MIDRGRVIRPLQAKLDEVKVDGLDVMLCSTEIIEKVIAMLKEQEAQHDYEASVEMAEYCERYEQTYNPEDGSM